MKNTTFQEMYDFFLAGITDDMFLELNEQDTQRILFELLSAALPHFEFPNHDIYTLDMENQEFTCTLTQEEKMIIRQYMIMEWIGYQLASIDNIRQKYSGSDFKFTSQAAHMDKLMRLRQTYQEEGAYLQHLYSRHKMDDEGRMVSTMSCLGPTQNKTVGSGM